MYGTRGKQLNKNKSSKITKQIIINNSMQEQTTPSKNTPTQKRLREVQQESLSFNLNKAPRPSITESPFKLITILENRFDKLAEQLNNTIEKKLNDYKEELLNEIDKRFISLQTDLHALNERLTLLETTTISAIKKSVHKLESDTLEFKSMKSEMLELKRKLNKQDNATIAGCVRIRGVPYKDDEDLYSIFNKLCKSLNVSTPQVDNIYRLTNIYKDNLRYAPRDDVIIVKMHAPYEKNYLLKTIAKYRHDNKSTLCLKHVGFDSMKPIYINENLTPDNHKIFQEALKLKKEKCLKSVYTQRGLVYVKKNDSDDPVYVEFFDELQRLFRN